MVYLRTVVMGLRSAALRAARELCYDVSAFIVKGKIDLVQALDNRHLHGLHEAILSTIQPRILQGQSMNLLISFIEHTP